LAADSVAVLAAEVFTPEDLAVAVAVSVAAVLEEVASAEE
jgi:hypothetical protein